jgi:hypothetical protein
MYDMTEQRPKKMHEAMALLGFFKEGKEFHNVTTEITVEFPSGPLGVGDEIISHEEITQTPDGKIKILSASDVVKDRIAHDLYSNDPQALIQALCVMLCHSITPEIIKGFCVREKSEEYFKKIESHYLSLKRSNTRDMADIESYIVDQLLENL